MRMILWRAKDFTDTTTRIDMFGLFETKYSSFDFVRYTVSLVDRCEACPEGNFVLELQPGTYSMCFGTPKRNKFLHFRKVFQPWVSSTIAKYCMSRFSGYPEEAMTAIFALDHGCGVALHEYRMEPLGRHITDSINKGLESIAEDLKYQAMNGRWPR